MLKEIPQKLFILELANNHMGDVEHGIQVIREFGKVCKDFPFKFAFKLQYRDLDTFIHPDFQNRSDIKYIKRFMETRLDHSQMRRLIDEIRANNFLAICTPFDEKSVENVVEHGFDILKIASCSLTDWPLLEKIAQTNKPLIASTGGASLKDIDNVVAFLEHREKNLVLMHCVAEYPTKDKDLQMNQINLLQKRYPKVKIGFSTHESPTETLPVTMAIAKGCVAFEKHVGVKTDRYPLNDYSANPEQVREWLTAAKRAYDVAGQEEGRVDATPVEKKNLHSLRRGLFTKRDVKVGERLTDQDVFFAIPTEESHITANDWSKYTRFYATAAIPAKQAVTPQNSRKEELRDTIYEIVQKVKNMLKQSNVIVPGEADLEISHHYGIEKFNETGITMITVVNREYCKKLIVVLPGQKHPNQFHKQKEETFHILHGTLTMTLDGVTKEYTAGSVVVVEKGVHHAFESAKGAVFEEISSTHYKDDSFYTDPAINQNKDRKTYLTHWMN